MTASPFPLMFHPTLIVRDLEEAAGWFSRVFHREPVRWEEKWDISLLNPDYPINYSYFFVLGDVCLDVLDPSLLRLPGGRAAVYPDGEGLADIAWYAEDIGGVARTLERSGYRTRDQEGNIIRDGNVPESNLVADCPMIWTLPEDTGMTYEFYHMAKRHRPRYSRRGDPRLDPAWVADTVLEGDPLGLVGSSHHTVLTADRENALRLYTSVLDGRVVGEGYSAAFDADTVYVEYAESVLEFASPREGSISDVLTGAPAVLDQYVGITFRVVDLEAVAAHLGAVDVPFEWRGGGIHTDPSASRGAVWSFIADGAQPYGD